MKQNVSSKVGIMMLAALTAGVCVGQQKNKIDASKTAVILPFESTQKGAVGLPEATRTAVVLWLKDDGMFAAVLTAEEAKDLDKATTLEIGATLVGFKKGTMAARVLVGFGSGRASATWDFTVKDGANGEVVWQKRIKKKASVWSNTASSASQRRELPEKVAKTFVKEMNKAKAK